MPALMNGTAKSADGRAADAVGSTPALGRRKTRVAGSVGMHSRQLVLSHSHILAGALLFVDTQSGSLDRLVVPVLDSMELGLEVLSIVRCNCNCSHSDQSRGDSRFGKSRKMIAIAVVRIAVHNCSEKSTPRQQLGEDIHPVRDRMIEHFQRSSWMTLADSNMPGFEDN